MEQLRTDIDSVSLRLADEVITGIEDIHRRYPNPSP
jgi:aryl-alcohol dehydrogenase-like predicted oxidoreductase